MAISYMTKTFKLDTIMITLSKNKHGARLDIYCSLHKTMLLEDDMAYI